MDEGSAEASDEHAVGSPDVALTQPTQGLSGDLTHPDALKEALVELPSIVLVQAQVYVVSDPFDSRRYPGSQDALQFAPQPLWQDVLLQ